jgi:hypothetical protein
MHYICLLISSDDIDTTSIGSEILLSHMPLELICVTKNEWEIPVELIQT